VDSLNLCQSLSSFSASSASSAVHGFCHVEIHQPAATSTAERAERAEKGHTPSGSSIWRPELAVGSSNLCQSVSASSASSAVSAVLRCEQQTVSTAERAELRGEGMEPMGTQMLVSWRDRASFQVSSWGLGVFVQ